MYKIKQFKKYTKKTVFIFSSGETNSSNLFTHFKSTNKCTTKYFTTHCVMRCLTHISRNVSPSHASYLDEWDSDMIEYYNNISISHSHYGNDIFVPTEKKYPKIENDFVTLYKTETWDDNDVNYYHNMSVHHSKNN